MAPSGGAVAFGAAASKPCFYYPQGRCFKGSACPYLHATTINTEDLSSCPPATQQSIVAPTPSQPTAPSVSRPFLEGATVCESAFVLSKQAPAPVGTSSAAAAAALPALYRDALKRKQGVNLYIAGGRVIWQFAFNEPVIAAIKAHVKGRQWDPSIGPKGCWTCPLESLPEAIALYEHMGRTPDAPLKARARQIIDAHGGGSAADAIRLTVQLVGGGSARDGGGGSSGGGGGGGADVIGRVVCAFQYDADVVAALKQLAPIQRAYDGQSKEWRIDLLALPELLVYLKDYMPSQRLTDLANLVERLEELLYEEEEPKAFSPPPSQQQQPPQPPPPHQAPPSLAEGSNASGATGGWLCEAAEDDLFDEALLSVDIDAIVAASQSSQQPPSQAMAPLSTSGDAPPPAAASSPGAASSAADTGEEEVAEVLELGTRETQIKSALTELQCLVRDAKAGLLPGAIDHSDCGAAKRRKFTAQQEQWARGGDAYAYSDGYSDDSDDWVSGLYLRAHQSLAARRGQDSSRGARGAGAAAADCDCGKPWKRVGGRHVCRYFGYFECGSGCGKRWTSAYTWKGERQACRACNRESAPYRTEQLDGREGMGNGKPHDSARCSMCRQLGRDCSV